MSPLLFYREQAEQQRLAAASATLENVRACCQRAFEGWSALAAHSEWSKTGDWKCSQASCSTRLRTPTEG